MTLTYEQLKLLGLKELYRYYNAAPTKNDIGLAINVNSLSFKLCGIDIFKLPLYIIYPECSIPTFV